MKTDEEDGLALLASRDYSPMPAALVRFAPVAAIIAAICGAGCAMLDDGSTDAMNGGGAGDQAAYDMGGGGSGSSSNGSSTGSSASTATGTSTEKGTGTPRETPVHFDDGDAIAFLERQCRVCHSAKFGRLDAAWPMPDVVTREWLESAESSATVYELLRRKLYSPTDGAYPLPMPDGPIDVSTRQAIAAMLRWFEERLPFSVADADFVAGRKPNALPRPKVSFACNTPANLSTFLWRLTNEALGRSPTQAELSLFSANDLSAPVTAAERQQLVARLSAEWKTEFAATGLAKLANGILTSGTIPLPSGVSFDGPPDETFSGATDELHQLFIAHYDDWDYARYFTENVVMATPATAPVYGCNVTRGVGECALTAPRAGFFSTLGYLSTMPQSFLRMENNTRRYVGMQTVLIGEAGPRNGRVGDVSSPPPDCIDDTDRRYQAGNYGGGNGTWSQLTTGQNCESCHMRGMSAATVLFRPFASSGRVYDPSHLGAAGTSDAADFAIATSASWVYADGLTAPRTQVDAAYLTRMLGSRKACVSTGDPAQPYLAVNDLNDLTRHLMRNPDAVTRGFVRNAHRAFSAGTDAPSFPTLDMEASALRSVDAGKTRVPDLVAAYFGSDSFACAEDL